MVQGCTSDAGKSALVTGICRVLARRGFRVTGLDVSREALERAPDGLRTVAARAEDLPFPPASFDAVIYVASLQFIDDYRKAMERSASVLRPAGRLIVMLLNPESEFFQSRFSDPDSYVSKVRHTDLQAIETAGLASLLASADSAAARAANANGTRLASSAKSASVPLVTSILTGVWSISPSIRART